MEKYKILLEKSKYLNNLNEDIITYESCIIKSNILNVWEFVLDVKKMFKIANSKYDIIYNDSNLKEGSFIKYYFDEIKMSVFMRIIQIKRTQKRKSWWIRFETIAAKIQKIPKFTECKITMIDKEKTQLSFLHKFPSNSNQEFINKFKIKIKEVIKKFKKYIEEQIEKEVSFNSEVDNSS